MNRKVSFQSPTSATAAPNPNATKPNTYFGEDSNKSYVDCSQLDFLNLWFLEFSLFSFIFSLRHESFISSALLLFNSFISVAVKLRNIFQANMFSFRRYAQPKFLFSTISFAALFFAILLTASFLCSFSLQNTALKSKRQSRGFPYLGVHPDFRSNSSSLNLLSVKEEIEEAHSKKLTAINNQTKEEKVVSFRDKLQELEILKPTALTHQFADRAQKFFETGCKVQFFMTWISPAEKFGRKEFFALESLFKAHPDGCLMILSRTMDSTEGNQILKPLKGRGFKVTSLAPNLLFLFNNTPAESWFDEVKKGIRDPGEIPLAQNLSNLLRLVVLYKYGGVYLDTDFIVLKKFSGLRNTIGAQSMNLNSTNWTRLNNAVLIFDKSHPLLYKFIEEFSLTFDGNKWGHNGPYLVSRVVEKVAGTSGFNFTVLPPLAFYPVDWIKIGGFFQRPESQAQSRWTAAKLLQLSGGTYGVHLWNKQSSRFKIEEGSIIGQLISNHCVLCENIYTR